VASVSSSEREEEEREVSSLAVSVEKRGGQRERNRERLGGKNSGGSSKRGERNLIRVKAFN